MKPKLIYLEWADAITNSRWFTLGDVENWIRTSEWIIKEAGWLISETEDYIVIATSWKPDDDHAEDQFCNLHKIPKGWIRKRRLLKL